MLIMTYSGNYKDRDKLDPTHLILQGTPDSKTESRLPLSLYVPHLLSLSAVSA